MKTMFATLAIAAAFLAACAADPVAPAYKVSATGAGQVLATGAGMTLYTFANDKEPGKSACNGQCAVNWPPFAAKADAAANGKWSVITRDDGAKQWAYGGKPLYTWARDQKPGDAGGNGLANGAWTVAQP